MGKKRRTVSISNELRVPSDHVRMTNHQKLNGCILHLYCYIYIYIYVFMYEIYYYDLWLRFETCCTGTAELHYTLHRVCCPTLIKSVNWFQTLWILGGGTNLLFWVSWDVWPNIDEQGWTAAGRRSIENGQEKNMNQSSQDQQQGHSLLGSRHRLPIRMVFHGPMFLTVDLSW